MGALLVGHEGGFLPSVLCHLQPNETSTTFVTARLVFDTGAANSFITTDMVNRAQLQEDRRAYENVTGIGGKVTRMLIQYVSCILISRVTGNRFEIKLRAIEQICAKLPPLDLEWVDIPEVDLLEVTEDLPRPHVNVDILVGNDLFSLLVNSARVAGEHRQHLIWDTQLGVTVSGKDKSNQKIASLMQTEPSDDQLAHELKQFWNWESLGIVKDQILLSPKEKYVVDHFYENVRYAGGRYQIALPFDPDLPKPKNNFGSALAQFKSLEKSLCRNESKKARYTVALEQYIKDGHAEKVFSAHPDKDVNRFFLPHHAIWRDNHPTTKARIVFNGSAADITGYTLNNSLLPGPKKQSDLCDILTRYRTFEHTLTGDIAKMFLQIGILPEHRDFLSFLWRPPGSSEPVGVYRKTVLPFGLNCSPYVAIQTIEYHLDKFGHLFPEAAELVRRQIFVDDVLMGGADTDKLVVLRQQTQDLLALGGFHLTKWLSNEAKVMLSIPEKDRAAAAPMVIAERDMLLSPEAIPRTLGIQWDPMSDCFQFQGALELIVPLGKETMRTLASRAAKVFDPLGLASPVLIQAKILMQRCWKEGLKWDDRLTEQISEPWLDWIRNLTHLHFLDVPRHLYIKNQVQIVLHGFSDASLDACSACVYARTVDKNGRVQVSLIASKTKLAPLQTASIPRLELMGALLLAKLVHKLTKCLDVYHVILWTDNTSVLQWLRKPASNWKTFVGNRVSQITELFPSEHFRHVGTQENPADIASRGMNADVLIKCRDWFEGPHFLHEREELWPESPIPAVDLSSVTAEQNVPADLKSADISLSLIVRTLEPDFMESLFDNIQPFTRNLRLLAFIIRFCHNSIPGSRESRYTSRYPSLKEHRNALKVWTRFVQEQSFQKELHALTAGEVVTKGPMRQLQPYYDHTSGLAKVGGRLQFSGLGEEAIHPAVLPAKSKYVESYVLNLHRSMNHLGGEGLLAQIRTRFWLLQGRREVKRILWRCKPCYRQRSPPFAQTIAPLPSGRVAATASWLFIGIDYAGPFYVLKEKIFPTDETEFAKVWVLLATDLASRAVHLEWMWTMTTNHMINALQRLIARRGYPKVIYSDNGKQFIKCDKEMQRLYQHLDWDKVERFAIQLPSRTEFRFSAPLAPHWGGVWERMVRSVKTALKSTLGNRRATLEEFRTVLLNAEACVNSRPLTLVSDDTKDPLPITPAHLNIGRSLMQIPDFLAKDQWNTKVALQWKTRQRLHSEFWGRWRKEYLTALQPSQKWTRPGHEPHVGEVVLLDDEPRARNEWPIARVLEVFQGRDGLVRSVLLFVKWSDKPIRRDVRKIYHFEESASEVELQTAELSRQTAIPDLAVGDQDNPTAVLPPSDPSPTAPSLVSSFPK